ncbi:MAG: hypothetical protein ACREQF_11050 [Candidatus Binataceae bacterium]
MAANSQVALATLPRSPAAGTRRTTVIVVTTGMLTFISFWRAAAVVLCDMASTV